MSNRTDNSAMISLKSLMQIEEQRQREEQEERKREELRAKEEERKAADARRQEELRAAEEQRAAAQREREIAEEKARREREVADLRARLDAERIARGEQAARLQAEREEELARLRNQATSTTVGAGTVAGFVGFLALVLGAVVYFAVVVPAQNEAAALRARAEQSARDANALGNRISEIQDAIRNRPAPVVVAPPVVPTPPVVETPNHRTPRRPPVRQPRQPTDQLNLEGGPDPLRTNAQ